MRRSPAQQKQEWHETEPLQNFARGLEFWRRATGIYLSYKVTQLRASFYHATGRDEEWIDSHLWKPQHESTGQRMYDLCVDLRGFYLKGGQFLGTRADFIPEEICRQLSKLHDQVPPMPGKKVEALLKRELEVEDLSEIFSEIDLESPLGSASIAQVHKGKLKSASVPPLYRVYSFFNGLRRYRTYYLQEGEQAWDLCDRFGIGYQELAKANKGIDLSDLTALKTVNVPAVEDMRGGGAKHKSLFSTLSFLSKFVFHVDGMGARRISAARHAMLRRDRPVDGTVAIKVQYPDALEIMKQDLGNIRTWANFLSKTEIQFDMVSAVDELRKQIELEFDFTREAKVMDSISLALQPIQRHVVIPQSIPGLVTQRLLVMSFIDGIPLRNLGERTASLSPRKKKLAKERILKRLCEAYGKMIFGNGLFQADGHPGNILIQKSARVGLLDYGQSKKLTQSEVHSFGKLVIALARDNTKEICSALDGLGIELGSDDPLIKKRLAFGMFDTRGRVNPFDKNSPIKTCSVSSFPPDLFFVLRVIQLIRGIKQGMDIDPNFSCAKQWSRFAKEAQKQHD